MSNTFPTNSTYVAPFTITDRSGDPLSPTAVTYAISERRGGSPILTKTDGDPGVTIDPDGDAGVVEVELGPSEVPVGTVFEELRVESGGETTVVTQRSVTFADTATEP